MRLLALLTAPAGRWARRVRARLAAEYLADPTVSTAAVAFPPGFSDQTGFNTTFRRWTGDAPGSWRRRRA
jgi:AraC-like DNA-binding protein